MARVKQLGVGDVQGEASNLLQQSIEGAVPTKGDAAIYLLELLGQGLGALSGNEQVAQFAKTVKGGNDAIRMEEALGQLERGEKVVTPFGLSAENQQRLVEQLNQKKALQAKVILDLLNQKQSVENVNAQMDQQETLFDKGQQGENERLDKTTQLQRDLSKEKIASDEKLASAQLGATYAGIAENKRYHNAALEHEATQKKLDRDLTTELSQRQAGQEIIKALMARKIKGVGGGSGSGAGKYISDLQALATAGLGEDSPKSLLVKNAATQMLLQLLGQPLDSNAPLTQEEIDLLRSGTD